MPNDAENPRPPEHFSLIEPLLAVIFAAVDLFLPTAVRASESVCFGVVLVGAVCGQFSLLCLWAVFGAERLLARWLGTLVVAALLYLALLLGVTVTEAPGAPGSTLRVAVAGVLILPLLFLGTQMPLWILRTATGWRIVVDGTQDAGSRRQSRQFALQHIFGATTAVAVALGLAGLAPRLLDGRHTAPDPAFWLGLTGGCLGYGLWALLWISPCLWAAFIARNKAASTAIIAVYAAVVSLLMLTVTALLWGDRYYIEPGGFFLLLGFFFFHGSLAAVLLGSLHLLRYSGYVLLRPGRRQPPAVSTGSSPLADAGDPSLPPSP